MVCFWRLVQQGTIDKHRSITDPQESSSIHWTLLRKVLGINIEPTESLLTWPRDKRILHVCSSNRSISRAPLNFTAFDLTSGSKEFSLVAWTASFSDGVFRLGGIVDGFSFVTCSEPPRSGLAVSTGAGDADVSESVPLVVMPSFRRRRFANAL